MFDVHILEFVCTLVQEIGYLYIGIYVLFLFLSFVSVVAIDPRTLCMLTPRLSVCFVIVSQLVTQREMGV